MNPRWLRVLLIWLAGGALLAAVAIDTLAMIGRQIALPLIGSIELVEAAILIASAGALIVATLDGAHARVNLLRERLPPGWRVAVEKVHALAALLLFAALFSGTVWIAADVWGGHEESELLRIPYAPLRIVAALSLGCLLLLAIRRLLTREKP